MTLFLQYNPITGCTIDGCVTCTRRSSASEAWRAHALVRSEGIEASASCSSTIELGLLIDSTFVNVVTGFGVGLVQVVATGTGAFHTAF